MKRFLFISGLAIGFVVGSRMGRGPYESLERTARQIVDDPEVQRKAAQARANDGGRLAGRVFHAGFTLKVSGRQRSARPTGTGGRPVRMRALSAHVLCPA